MALDYLAVDEAPLSPYRYGFVGDGVTDDTLALQAAIDAVPAGGSMWLPHVQNAKITAPLSITKAITILGRSVYNQRIYAVGCNGFNIAAGVNDVHMENFEIAQAVRYSSSPNTFIGINIDGTSTAHTQNHVYRDIYVDGFQVAYRGRYLWGTYFDNCRSTFGLVGIMALGLSVNNNVNACAFNTSGGAGSRGIALLGQESSTDATPVASEGWMINNTLTVHAEVGVDFVAYNHCQLTNSIIDFNTLYGVRVVHSGPFFANNIRIAGNYIALDGTGGAAGVVMGNNVSNFQVRYSRITDNDILVYTGLGASAPQGIWIVGSNAPAIIRGNSTQGFSTSFDCLSNTPDCIIADNAFMSTGGSGGRNVAAAGSLVENNVGVVARSGIATTATYSRDSLGRKVVRATAAPTSGTWALGDRVIRDVPTVGQPKAWVCTAAGSPGTWVSEGIL